MGGVNSRPAEAPGRAARSGTVLALLLGPMLLSGCKTPSFLCFSSGGLKRLTITSAPDSNAGRPIAIDLVYVTDKKIVPAIEGLKARNYFATREQLLRDFPRGLARRGWELQAGQQVVFEPVSSPCNLAGTFLFVDMGGSPPQDNRVRLGKVKAGVLTIGANDFDWAAGKGKSGKKN